MHLTQENRIFQLEFCCIGRAMSLDVSKIEMHFQYALYSSLSVYQR